MGILKLSKSVLITYSSRKRENLVEMYLPAKESFDEGERGFLMRTLRGGMQTAMGAMKMYQPAQKRPIHSPMMRRMSSHSTNQMGFPPRPAPIFN